jgi:hypothetical protein
MESPQKEGIDKDILSFVVKAVLGASAVGTLILIGSSILGVESFKLRDCSVQNNSIKGCELERHSGIPNGLKIALDVLGSSLIASSMTIAFLEIGLRNSNKNLLVDIIKKQHTETITSIDNNFSKKIKDGHEKIREIVKGELITTKDIHEFYPSYTEYVREICQVSEQKFDSQDSRKSSIDIIEIGDKLLPDINHGLCSKVLCGWKVRLLIVNKNDQTIRKAEALCSLLKERIDQTKGVALVKEDGGAAKKFCDAKLGSLEIAFLLDNSKQSFDYFRLNNISSENNKEELLFMCFHESDGNISLPGFSIANPSVRNKFEAYFNLRWRKRRSEPYLTVNAANPGTDFYSDIKQSQTQSELVVPIDNSPETKTLLTIAILDGLTDKTLYSSKLILNLISDCYIPKLGENI